MRERISGWWRLINESFMCIDYESKELMSHVGNFHARFARKVDAGSKLDSCGPLYRSVLK